MLWITKVISVVLALSLILGVTAFSADAVTPEVAYFTVENAKYDGGFAPVMKENRYYSGSYNYYDQLSTFQKYIFDSVKAMTPGQTVLVVTYPRYDGDINTAISELEGGVFAVFKDYPEFFWLNGAYGGSVSHIPMVGYIQDLTVTFEFISNSIYPDPATTKQQLEAAIDAFTVTDGTRYDMLLEIHDKISLLTTYSPCVSQELSSGITNKTHESVGYCNTCAFAHEATGVFLKYGTQTVNYAVCEGYAEAFKLICDKYEIPCALVISDDHMWNVVRMEDNKWYAIDVTWDDQGSVIQNIYHDFFLVGASTVPTYFSGGAFSQSHVPTGYFSPDGPKLFAYPTLEETAFTFPNWLYYSENAMADYTDHILILWQINNIWNSGTKVIMQPTIYGTGTGTTFMYNSSRWSIVIRGDVTGDGVVDNSDFNDVLNASIGIPGKMTENSVYLLAGDAINMGSGLIDAQDVMAVELIRSGHVKS